jgi:hypothetical protein
MIEVTNERVFRLLAIANGSTKLPLLLSTVDDFRLVRIRLFGIQLEPVIFYR